MQTLLHGAGITKQRALRDPEPGFKIPRVGSPLTAGAGFNLAANTHTGCGRTVMATPGNSVIDAALEVASAEAGVEPEYGSTEWFAEN